MPVTCAQLVIYVGWMRFACTVLAIAVTVHAVWTLYGNSLDHHEETQALRQSKLIYSQQSETIDIRQFDRKTKVSYSNQSNNNDYQKHKHPSRDSADSEVLRMKRAGVYVDCERLKIYYNRGIDGWFVGRGWAHRTVAGRSYQERGSERVSKPQTVKA